VNRLALGFPLHYCGKMRGVTGLALIFAIVFAMLTLTLMGTFEASITTLTGGAAGFVQTIPTLFVFLIGVMGVFLLVGFVGQFFTR
jgi:ABC-type proline/glycine betaine transport system permease subunit